MSMRIWIRIFVPSSFRVAKTPRTAAAATSTQKFLRRHASCYDISPSFVPNMHERRLFSQQAATEVEELTVDYDYVKKATLNDGTLIVDVREPEEVKEHGKIPNSINIPLANVVPVLSNLSEKEFQQMYERAKPKEDTEMIFYCMIGKRSGKAQQNALSLGFKNAKNYLGSWTDWATKTQ